MSNKECENCGYFCYADSMCHRLDYPINDISKIRDDCPRKEEIIMESMRCFQEEHCGEQEQRTGEVLPKADLDKTEEEEE